MELESKEIADVLKIVNIKDVMCMVTISFKGIPSSTLENSGEKLCLIWKKWLKPMQVITPQQKTKFYKNVSQMTTWPYSVIKKIARH